MGRAALRLRLGASAQHPDGEPHEVVSERADILLQWPHTRGWWTSHLISGEESVGTSRAAGWYPDPEHPDALRWWDGSAWTQHRAPLPQRPLGAPRPVRLRHRPRGWVLTGAALAALATLAVTGAASLVADDQGSEAPRRDTTATTPADPTGATDPGPSPTGAPDPTAPG